MTFEENVRAILESNFAGFKEEIIEIATKVICELNPWIPVSERLPEEEMNCLVTDSLENVHEVTFYPALDGRESYFSGCYCVRAWMPLPSAYTESEGEG